jgi:hypothetical protein
MGAAFCGTGTRTAHRRSARRTRGAPQVLIGEGNFTNFRPNVTLSGESRHPIHRTRPVPGSGAA